MTAAMNEQEPLDPLHVALAMIPLGALAGLAALLRSQERITKRAVAAAMLNSAIFCAAISALMFWHFGDTQVFLNLGVSMLAGLGGNTLIGVAIRIMQGWAESHAK